MQHGDYFIHPFKLTMLSAILIIEHQGFEHFLFCTMAKLLPHVTCCNLSLGLMTEAKACKGASQEGSPGVTSHTSGSVGECEGMNPDTPK